MRGLVFGPVLGWWWLVFVALGGVLGSSVQYNPSRGFYDAPFNLTLSSKIKGATIMYTLDPLNVKLVANKTNIGIKYQTPLLISKTTVVHSIAFSTTDSTALTSHTFIFTQSVVSTLDTRITSDPTYGPQIAPALRYLTVGFSYYGVLLNNNVVNYGVLEYLDPDRPQDNWAMASGFEIYGGLSATYQRTSLRAHLDSDLDWDFFSNYTFGGNPAVKTFGDLNFRASQDAFGYIANPTFIKNWFTDHLLLRMGNAVPHGRFLHLYLNGNYWGVYHLREIFTNDNAIQEYWGGQKSINYTLIRYPEGITAPSWVAASAAKTMDQAKTTINLQNYINYLILETWAGNYDWGGHNWQAIGQFPTTTPSPGFQFFSSDMDISLWGSGPDDATSAIPGVIWSNLITLPEFKMMLADTIYRQVLKPSGVLYTNNTIALWNKAASIVYDIIVADCAKWCYNNHVNWNIPASRTRTNTIRDTWLVVRGSYYKSIMTGKGYYPPLDPPTLNPTGGNFINLPSVSFSPGCTVGTLYYTLDGSDPRTSSGTLNSSAKTWSSGSLVLPQSPLVHVKARCLSSSNVWSALEEEVYATKNCYLCGKVVITEVMHSPANSEGKWIELKNIGNETVDLTGAHFGMVYYPFPSSTYLAPGEFYVIGYDLSDFYLINRQVLSGKFFGSMSNLSPLTLYDINDNIVFEMMWGTKFPWPEAANDLGNSVVLKSTENIRIDSTSPTLWRASTNIGGSPFADDPPSPYEYMPVRVNEAYWNSTHNWIELYNFGDDDIDISKWRLTNDTNIPRMYSFPTGTVINSKDYLVVTQTQSSFFVSPQANIGLFSIIVPGTLSGERVALDVSPSLDDCWGYYSDESTVVYMSLVPTPGASNIPLIGPLYMSVVPSIKVKSRPELEFIQLQVDPVQVPATGMDLSGYQIAGSITYTFPKLIVKAGQRITIYSSTADVNSLTDLLQLGASEVVIGPFTGNLQQNKIQYDILKPVGSSLVKMDGGIVPGAILVSKLTNATLPVTSRKRPLYFGDQQKSWEVSNIHLHIVVPEPPPAPQVNHTPASHPSPSPHSGKPTQPGTNTVDEGGIISGLNSGQSIGMIVGIV